MATAPAGTPPELISRLRRAEGQLRGVQRMLEQDAAPREILVQLAAVKAAVDQVGLRLISSELKACVDGEGDRCADDLDEALATFLRFGSLTG
jgi:DNA-binding FrmR family transcriptional regulator